MQAQPLDYIWISCIVIVNILFFVRKSILLNHGFKTGLLDLELKDWKMLKELSTRDEQCRFSCYYKILNISISVLFVCGLLVLLCTRTPIFK